ncbi:MULTISPECIES: hypothetical protein [unclassified Candidatus Frackibacter]|uniref:hypothetical protein n=1 Tax=unclassified Candidatus Frackibacter TaxID=2648818 RepID=UPI000888B1F3|nr:MULTISPECIES: hypothetical protein [unclassified Candidatus Frackibacter]SDB96958.1 hypothetical protein SAMN04515661_10159 [Candidatus Frackibacter sp. WG11]SEM28525.1 hypothetical protein SAMN04488698_10160 [Candidatus Frackibacter sp. WG12]SFL33419.1 hypothetical protein SAMN04488699_10161 [Candidatus Frackibacter sp. WG13]
MKIKGVKVELVVIVLIISLGLFFGTQYYLNNYRLENSLTEKLTVINGVEKVKIEDANKGKEINLTLVAVDDLQKTYQQINEVLINSIGKNNYSVKLNNSNNEKLNSLYRRMHLSIYESMMTGEFTKMASRLDTISNKLRVKKAEVSVDQNNIYLQLSDNQDYFYKVIEREYPGLNKVTFQGGGVNG